MKFRDVVMDELDKENKKLRAILDRIEAALTSYALCSDQERMRVIASHLNDYRSIYT